MLLICSPCWCGPGISLAFSREMSQINKSSREHEIPLPFILLILQAPHSAKPMPAQLLDQAWNSSGSLREEIVKLAKNLKWKLMTATDINQLHRMFCPAGFFQ